jgi:hypothetical protein
MTARRRALVLATALVGLASAHGASAAGPGSWSRMMEPAQTSTGQIGLARTGPPQRFLHVAWKAGGGPAGNDLVHQWIMDDGRLSSWSRIASGWAETGDVALLRSIGGMTAWFTGRRTLETTDPGGLFVSKSPFGTTWSAPTLVYQDATVHGRTPGVAAWNGRFFQAWYDVVDTVVHVGEAGGALSYYTLGGSRCCSYQQNLASDGASLLVAWCSGNDAPNGIWVHGVDSSGARAGVPRLMPGSAAPFEGRAVRACEATGRVPLVARVGGGYYVADGSGYPSTTRVLLWRVGAVGTHLVAAGAGEKRTVAIAAAPDGRLWVAWSVRGTNRLFFRRSNRDASVFGQPVSFRFPTGEIEATELDLSAQRDRVDVLARFLSLRGIGFFHSQIYPGLTLRATGGRVATFRVTDAGDPVAGASVRVAERTLTTNARGTATAELPPGRYLATASKPEYASASARVRIERRGR